MNFMIKKILGTSGVLLGLVTTPPALAQSWGYNISCLAGYCITKQQNEDGSVRVKKCYNAPGFYSCSSKEVQGPSPRKPLGRGLIYSGRNSNNILACGRDSLPIRQYPNLKSEIIGIVDAYSCVQVLEESGDGKWLYVKGGGYVSVAELRK